MGAVAARHELAVERRLLAVAALSDPGMVILDVLDGRCLRLEPDLAAVRQPLQDQVLDHFLLAVDRDAAACQSSEVDAVLVPSKAKLDTVVDEARELG